LLDRLEIELLRQWARNGNRNGDLVCTYEDFSNYGIRRSSIPSAIKLAKLTGLLEVTERGRFIAGDMKYSSRYRLTYLPTKDAPASDEWRRFGDGKAVAKSRLHNFSRDPKTCLGRGPKTCLQETSIPRPENVTPGRDPKTHLSGTRKRDSPGPENVTPGNQFPRPENVTPYKMLAICRGSEGSEACEVEATAPRHRGNGACVDAAELVGQQLDLWSKPK
jgi:hypothetical protein